MIAEDEVHNIRNPYLPLFSWYVTFEMIVFEISSLDDVSVINEESESLLGNTMSFICVSLSSNIEL